MQAYVLLPKLDSQMNPEVCEFFFNLYCQVQVLKDITNCYSEPKPTSKKSILEPLPGTSHVLLEENKVLSEINTPQMPTNVRQNKTPKKYLLSKCRKHLKHICQLRNRIKKK